MLVGKYRLLSPTARDVLEDYAAGVNAWLADDYRQYGLEITLVRLLTGTPAWDAAAGYRAAVRDITYARATGPIAWEVSSSMADRFLTAWMHARAALLP